MSEIIRKRRSVRKYEPKKPDDNIIMKVREKTETLTPLISGIRYSVEIADKTRGIFGVAAPCYLVFRSEKKDGYLENVGFLGQQMSLFLSESGFGSCWLGMAKPEESGDNALPFVICIAFGTPAEPLFRELSEFKRKSLSEISEGSDPRLEAARLAPSGMNAQNWFFLSKDSVIHCYYKKPNPMLGNRLARIDIGIALCHIYEESEVFSFSAEKDAPEKRGYIYAGTVTEG